MDTRQLLIVIASVILTGSANGIFTGVATSDRFTGREGTALQVRVAHLEALHGTSVRAVADIKETLHSIEIKLVSISHSLLQNQDLAAGVHQNALALAELRARLDQLQTPPAESGREQVHTAY